MTRGTTPTIQFTLPFPAERIAVCSIAFFQLGEIVIEKKLEDCTCSENILSVTLDEADTLRFNSSFPLEIQIRCEVSGSKLASNIIKTEVGRILKDGAL